MYRSQSAAIAALRCKETRDSEFLSRARLRNSVGEGLLFDAPLSGAAREKLRDNVPTTSLGYDELVRAVLPL